MIGQGAAWLGAAWHGQESHGEARQGEAGLVGDAGSNGLASPMCSKRREPYYSH